MMPHALLLVLLGCFAAQEGGVGREDLTVARAPGVSSFGRQLWDASLIRVPTLVIRSERDFWSRPEDVETIAAHLVHAPVRTVTIPGATHFVHLDRPERGREQFLREVLAFLAQRAMPSK